MTWAEIGLAATTLVTVTGAVTAIIRDRRKPQLDQVNSDLVRAQVRKMTDEVNAERDLKNARRDLRMLRLDTWAFDKVLPWGRDAVIKFDKQSDLVHELASALGREVESIHLDPFPEPPPPVE